MLLVFILTHFPAVTFGLLPAETIPIGIFYRFFHKKIFRFELALLGLFAASVFYGVLIWNSIDLEVLRAVGAYLNPLFAATFFLTCSMHYVKKFRQVTMAVLVFFIFLGGTQLLVSNQYVNELISFIVPRGSFDPGAGGRGISLLTTEPSRASIELLFAYSIVRCSVDTKLSFLYFDILIFCFVLVALKSFIGLLFCFVFFTCLYGTRVLVGTISFLLVGFAVLIFYPEEVITFFKAERYGFIVMSLASADSMEHLLETLVDLSGFRLVTLIGIFNYVWDSPFGGGVGFWKQSSVEALWASDINPWDVSYFAWRGIEQFSSIRPNSYVSALVLDFGLFSVIPMSIIFFGLIKKTMSRAPRAVTAIFLFHIFVNGTVGLIIPWVALIVCYRFATAKV